MADYVEQIKEKKKSRMLKKRAEIFNEKMF